MANQSKEMMEEESCLLSAAAFEERVIETAKRCQQRHDSPVMWAVEMTRCLKSGPGSVVELGEVLVSYLCFQNNHPSLWKFLDYALTSNLLSPIHILSLLTSRVIPHRRSQPQAFRLYLELLSRYALNFHAVASEDCNVKIIESVDACLQLSRTYNVRVVEFGHALVLSFFDLVVRLIDSLFEDMGLQVGSLDQQSMEIDSIGNFSVGSNEHFEQIRRKNSLLAIEVLNKLMDSSKAMVLLRLIHFNMPESFNGLLQRLQFLEANKLESSKLKTVSQLLARLCDNVRNVPSYDYKLNKHRFIGMLIDTKSLRPMRSCNSESSWSSCWLSFDIFMENSMDGKQLPVTSAIIVLTRMITTLRVLNRASWQETFLALWLSALRLVQRERDPPEGPVPHLEARLGILLSIVPLAIANVLAEQANIQLSTLQGSKTSGSIETGCGHGMEEKSLASKKEGLVSSLQALGNFSALLCPPASVACEANNAAAKAASFISVSKNMKDGICSGSPSETLLNSGGNMRHLIVEACIARNLIDASAYYWPGYVSASVIAVNEFSPVQKSPWSMFMEGAPLNGSLVNLLFSTPASSLAEIEKLYHIALTGSSEERSAAAKILCGASLARGWNIQEHVVRFVVKLLSPPIPPGYTGPRSHLVDHMPMLTAIFFGASSVDTVHILSLHGLVPDVVASLMPLCEVFGSLVPTSSSKSSTGDEPSVYMVFSCAFLFLVRLWKFYRPPHELCLSGGTLAGELTLEYLLLLHNSHIASRTSAAQSERNSNLDQLDTVSDDPIYIDHFPKLRAWYCQNKTCIASTLSGLCSGNPVHQVANKILSMIYSKMTKTGASSSNSSTPPSGSASESPACIGEDAYQRPMLPAWEVLEAIPFVLEAILSACAYGRLSSRDLITGLRELVDFLPASIATIISYFSAEISRGIWKAVPMNGTDWPSPAPMLPSIESEIKEILAAVGVSVPCCSAGTSPLTLPLPVAVLVSLTITFKLTKSLDYIHAVIGPALENCAAGCSWPCIPIIGSLWAQKVRRWHDFIVVSCSRSVFWKNQEAVSQLLRSCFTSFLGSLHVSSLLTNQSSVNNLLGSDVAARAVCPSLAPGYLYLRSCRTIHNVQHVNDVIVGLVAEFAREAAAKWASSDLPRLKSSQASLSLATSKAREVASLGASLLCATAGLQVVQELYRETIPTWLLSSRDEKLGKVSAVAHIMEGYAMAYMWVLSGGLIWGFEAKMPSWAVSRRRYLIGTHFEYLSRALEGNIKLGCDPATWRAYVSCLVGLVVSSAPAWIQEVKPETLRKLASGLRGWHECELALSLLERGGIGSIPSVMELLHVIN